MWLPQWKVVTMQTKNFSLPSIRGESLTSDITIQQGQYTVSVAINEQEILSKIRGNPWTVDIDAEPWQIADAAAALCKCSEGS